MKTRVRKLIERFKFSRPGYARGLREQVEAGLLGDDVEMEEPLEPMAGGSGYKQALKDSAKAIIDDATLSVSEKLQKLKVILTMAEEDEGDDGEAAAEESRRRYVGSGSYLRERREAAPPPPVPENADGRTVGRWLRGA